MDNEKLTVFTLDNTKEIFFHLENCQGVEQHKEWHPEGDVFDHALQTVKWAFRETDDVDLILAALLHDVGKQVKSLGHEQYSCELLKGCVSTKTLFLIENHMRVWYYINGEMKKLSKCKELAEHPWLPELIQLARFDKKGRNPNVKVKYDKDDLIERLNKASMQHFRIPEGLKKEIQKITVAGLIERQNNKATEQGIEAEQG